MASAESARPKRSRTRCLAPSNPELGDESGLAQRGVLAGLLAESRGIALDVEQIVGDLKGFAERAAVIVKRLVFLRR